jgi:hypothetical protein
LAEAKQSYSKLMLLAVDSSDLSLHGLIDLSDLNTILPYLILFIKIITKINGLSE